MSFLEGSKIEEKAAIYYTLGIQSPPEKGFREPEYLSFREVIEHPSHYLTVIGCLRNRGLLHNQPHLYTLHSTIYIYIYTSYIYNYIYISLLWLCFQSPFSEKNLVVREEDSQRLTTPPENATPWFQCRRNIHPKTHRIFWWFPGVKKFGGVSLAVFVLYGVL